MTRTSKTFTRLSALTREPRTLADRYANPKTAKQQPDRGSAILAAADLENALEGALTTRMRILTSEEAKDIFQGDGAPLASFRNKILIAFSLAICGRNTKKEINNIRQIRNAFAHAKRPITFKTQEVADCCGLLRYTERLPRPHFSQYPRNRPWPPKKPRDRYLQSGKHLAAALILFSEDEYDPELPLD